MSSLSSIISVFMKANQNLSQVFLLFSEVSPFLRLFTTKGHLGDFINTQPITIQFTLVLVGSSFTVALDNKGSQTAWVLTSFSVVKNTFVLLCTGNCYGTGNCYVKTRIKDIHFMGRVIQLQRDPAGSYVCEFCDKSYPAKRELEGHINNHHLNHKPYSCTVCTKSFVYKKGLTYHMKISHFLQFTVFT